MTDRRRGEERMGPRKEQEQQRGDQDPNGGNTAGGPNG